jgi:hypothetical protein
MAKLKYAHLVQPLRLAAESGDPSNSSQMIHLVFDGKVQPETESTPKRKSTRKPKAR